MHKIMQLNIIQHGVISPVGECVDYCIRSSLLEACMSTLQLAKTIVSDYQ